MREIYHCFWIDAPIEQVYTAITKKSGLSGWWTRGADARDQIDTMSTFRFKSGAFNRMKIRSLKPDKVEWVCVDGHKEWIGTQIVFDLRTDGNRTKVCFSHCGWPEQSEYTGECSFHWAYYMISLKQFCETGRGTPDEGL